MESLALLADEIARCAVGIVTERPVAIREPTAPHLMVEAIDGVIVPASGRRAKRAKKALDYGMKRWTNSRRPSPLSQTPIVINYRLGYEEEGDFIIRRFGQKHMDDVVVDVVVSCDEQRETRKG